MEVRPWPYASLSGSRIRDPGPSFPVLCFPRLPPAPGPGHCKNDLLTRTYPSDESGSGACGGVGRTDRLGDGLGQTRGVNRFSGPWDPLLEPGRARDSQSGGTAAAAGVVRSPARALVCRFRCWRAGGPARRVGRGLRRARPEASDSTPRDRGARRAKCPDEAYQRAWRACPAAAVPLEERHSEPPPPPPTPRRPLLPRCTRALACPAWTCRSCLLRRVAPRTTPSASARPEEKAASTGGQQNPALCAPLVSSPTPPRRRLQQPCQIP